MQQKTIDRDMEGKKIHIFWQIFTFSFKINDFQGQCVSELQNYVVFNHVKGNFASL